MSEKGRTKQEEKVFPDDLTYPEYSFCKLLRDAFVVLPWNFVKLQSLKTRAVFSQLPKLTNVL